jgi:hypothetical protein
MHSGKILFNIYYYHLHVSVAFATTISVLYKNKKGKEIPLQGWTGPEGSKRLRLSDFKTIGT